MELNEDVTRIGDNAFRACTALTSIDFPESLVSIGDYAFYTSGLTSLVVPNTVQQMGRMAFAGSALTEVSVGQRRQKPWAITPLPGAMPLSVCL